MLVAVVVVMPPLRGAMEGSLRGLRGAWPAPPGTCKETILGVLVRMRLQSMSSMFCCVITSIYTINKKVNTLADV
eukprot:scaffold144958_cov25-Prasinocladus_malaysianus.AAC.1